jgi:hypothetical protein
VSPRALMQVLFIGAGVLLLVLAAANAGRQRAFLALLGAAFLATGVWFVPLVTT